MQELLKVPSPIKNQQWLDIVETLTVLGSIGGSIASVVLNQVVFASIPLSLSVTLSLVNRRLLLDAITQSNQTAVTQLIQENVQTHAQLRTLSEQLAEVNQLTMDLQGTTNLEITQLTQENVQTQAQLGTLTEQLAEVNQLTTSLSLGNSNLQNYTQTLYKEQMKIAEMVGFLREIETYTQIIRIKPNDANAYYSRGHIYQHLGDKEEAIGDYTEAIRINPIYAEAYYNRGLIRAELGDKKKAVEDFREAAKHFFEEGDISNYQIARDLSKKFYELSSQPKSVTPEPVVIERLFT